MRSFYAYSQALSAAGEQTNLLHGSFLELFKHVKQFTPRRTILTWDSRSTFRQALWAGYKARKVGSGLTSQQFSSYNRQMAIFHEGLQYLNILQYANDGVEGDDLIALCTLQAENRPAVIVSTDRDFWQLIQAGVELYNPRTKSLLGLSGFTSETGFDSPAHHLAFKCIKGDAGDGVPPLLKRLGESKAKEFARLLTFPEEISRISETSQGLDCPPLWEKHLQQDLGWQELARNFKLLSLYAAVMIQKDILSRLKPLRGQRNYDRFMKFCQHYELNMVAKAYGEVVNLV